MFSIGIFEILILCTLALVILGPEKFPKLAKELARLIHQLRSVKDDVHHQMSSIQKESSSISQEITKKNNAKQ